MDPLTEHECGEGEKLDNQGIKSIPCSRDREKLIVNNVRDLVKTQRAECAHSGTRGENSGANHHQVSGNNTSLDLPALRPSGHLGPHPRHADDPLQSPLLDLPKCE